MEFGNRNGNPNPKSNLGIQKIECKQRSTKCTATNYYLKVFMGSQQAEAVPCFGRQPQAQRGGRGAGAGGGAARSAPCPCPSSLKLALMLLLCCLLPAAVVLLLSLLLPSLRMYPDSNSHSDGVINAFYFAIPSFLTYI
jgi:hypothetical protein